MASVPTRAGHRRQHPRKASTPRHRRHQRRRLLPHEGRPTPKGATQTNLEITARGRYFYLAASGYFILAIDTSPAASPIRRDQGVVLHILFVCTGNICRSPTAERLAAAYGGQLGIRDFEASSAGVRAVIAHPIHHDAALILEQLGGDVSDFAARQLTPGIAARADLVLTMTRAHREAVLERNPKLLRRTFTLSEASRLASAFSAQTVNDLATLRPQLAAHESWDITDPIGQGMETFAMVGSQIAELLPPVLQLCKRSSTTAVD